MSIFDCLDMARKSADEIVILTSSPANERAGKSAQLPEVLYLLLRNCQLIAGAAVRGDPVPN
ncbi:MAG TPA: hypothetical protein VMA09_19765 [Candidatus Binataceae bacterium]|nr:hypothetical protein [Candidatus Binataceae bacterium]